MEQEVTKVKKEKYFLWLVVALIVEACFLLVLMFFLNDKYQKLSQQIFDLQNQEISIQESGLNFTKIPAGWSLAGQDKNMVKFETDFENHKVYLVGKFEQKGKVVESNLSENKIEEIACGGVFSCEMVELVSGEKFDFVWEIMSDEKRPENLDGIWTPTHNVQKEQIFYILRGVKK